MHRKYVYFFRRQKADNDNTRQLYRYYEMWDVIVSRILFTNRAHLPRMYNKELPGGTFLGHIRKFSYEISPWILFIYLFKKLSK